VAKAKLKIRGGNLDELEAERNEAERQKILFVEASFVIFFSLAADIIELIPFYIGEVLAAPITFGIFIWAFLRRVRGRWKILTPLKGLDLLLDGWLPLGTIASMLIIWLNNRYEGKIIDRITGILSGRL